MTDLDCRVAKLEQRMDGLCRERNEDKAETKDLIDKIFGKLDAILDTQSKQKGFWSGVAFILSAIAGSFGIIIYFVTGKAS